MLKLLLRWALTAMALMLVPEVVSGVTVESYSAALISALVLGLVNALLRPLLIVLTLPLTVVTFGLFALVINGLMFWLVAHVIEGLHVASFGAAFWGALVYGLLGWVINIALQEADRPS